MRARTRAPLAVLLYFGFTLGPALGFVNVFPFRFSFVADHFQYLAGAGVIALTTALIDGLVRRVRTPSVSVSRGSAVLVLGLTLGVLTWNQQQIVRSPPHPL
ncbi:MAG TPA: hypothetical protein VHC90_05345 [Bryobacteraceae bacterium]|nr:hypothetical protein [Bryobacteraceae bacterium]